MWSVENDALFIWMNFNELDAYWLIERSACLQVTKLWKMTLSCHSKNVLDLVSKYLKHLLPKIYLLGFFLNVQVMLLMPIGAVVWVCKVWGWVFFNFFKSFIRVIDGLVVYLWCERVWYHYVTTYVKFLVFWIAYLR